MRLAPLRLVCLALPALVCLALPVRAHETGLSYLRIQVHERELDVALELGLGDAAVALGLPSQTDPNVDLEVAREALWQEIAARSSELEQRVREALTFTQDGAACALVSDPAVFERAEVAGFARLRLRARCPAEVETLGLAFTLPFESDPVHRALVSVTSGDAIESVILSARLQQVELPLRAQGAAAIFATYLVEGVRHIASGPDHLLFLIALLLPAPLLWDGRRWTPQPRARAVALEVLWIVTAFTLAHSLTLALCVLGAVSLPARAVESAIAASVVVAALNGIRPFLRGRAWRIAFAFGLLHGLGFARSLLELGLPPVARASALLAFNVGVELGQLAVVAACLPLLLLLRRQPVYRSFLLPALCTWIAALAALWLVERLGGPSLLS